MKTPLDKFFLEHVSDHFECSISGNKEFFRNYIHFSSELSSSKNFSFTLLDLTISAQREAISLLSREMVQPSTGSVFFKQSFIDDVGGEYGRGYSEL